MPVGGSVELGLRFSVVRLAGIVQFVPPTRPPNVPPVAESPVTSSTPVLSVL